MLEFLEELDKFNNIVYHDEPHVYYMDGVKMKSVTTILGDYKEKFQADYWAQRKADERGISKEEVLEEWRIINVVATTKGTIVHNYLENRLANKVFPYPEEMALKSVGVKHAPIVKKKVMTLQEMSEKFLQDIKGKLIPVKSELVVGDAKLGICGMVDQMFYNKKVGELQIWDWKTNKKLNRNNNFGKFLKRIFKHLAECELSIYSLQLCIYREIIRRNTNLVVGDCYIVWFFEENETYEVIKCLDLTEEVKILFDLLEREYKL